MEERLIPETGHTKIKISLKDYERSKFSSNYRHMIDEFIRKYGGKELNRTTRYVYFEINTNLLKKS